MRREPSWQGSDSGRRGIDLTARAARAHRPVWRATKGTASRWAQRLRIAPKGAHHVGRHSDELVPAHDGRFIAFHERLKSTPSAASTRAPANRQQRGTRAHGLGIVWHPDGSASSRRARAERHLRVHVPGGRLPPRAPFRSPASVITGGTIENAGYVAGLTITPTGVHLSTNVREKGQPSTSRSGRCRNRGARGGTVQCSLGDGQSRSSHLGRLQ